MQIKDQDMIADLIPLRDTLLPKLVEWLSIFTRLDCKASKLEICAPSNLLMHYGAPSYCYQPIQIALNNYNSRSETSSIM
jgi:hypothetical protein